MTIPSEARSVSRIARIGSRIPSKDHAGDELSGLANALPGCED